MTDLETKHINDLKKLNQKINDLEISYINNISILNKKLQNELDKLDKYIQKINDEQTNISFSSLPHMSFMSNLRRKQEIEETYSEEKKRIKGFFEFKKSKLIKEKLKIIKEYQSN